MTATALLLFIGCATPAGSGEPAGPPPRPASSAPAPVPPSAPVERFGPRPLELPEHRSGQLFGIWHDGTEWRPALAQEELPVYGKNVDRRLFARVGSQERVLWTAPAGHAWPDARSAAIRATPEPHGIYLSTASVTRPMTSEELASYGPEDEAPGFVVLSWSAEAVVFSPEPVPHQLASVLRGEGRIGPLARASSAWGSVAAVTVEGDRVATTRLHRFDRDGTAAEPVEIEARVAGVAIDDAGTVTLLAEHPARLYRLASDGALHGPLLVPDPVPDSVWRVAACGTSTRLLSSTHHGERVESRRVPDGLADPERLWSGPPSKGTPALHVGCHAGELAVGWRYAPRPSDRLWVLVRVGERGSVGP